MRRIIGSALLVMGAVGSALATGPFVPEIDAASAATAVSLVIGGLLIVRARAKR